MRATAGRASYIVPMVVERRRFGNGQDGMLRRKHDMLLKGKAADTATIFGEAAVVQASRRNRCSISPTMPRRNSKMHPMKMAPITICTGRPESAR